MEVKIVITDARFGRRQGSGRVGRKWIGYRGRSVWTGRSVGRRSGRRGESVGAGPGRRNRCGPAPSAATFGASGAPEPFVGQRAANVLGPAGGGRSTDESGGAAPGSGSGMEDVYNGGAEWLK